MQKHNYDGRKGSDDWFDGLLGDKPREVTIVGNWR